jgi:hypothetical protein
MHDEVRRPAQDVRRLMFPVHVTYDVEAAQFFLASVERCPRWSNAWWPVRRGGQRAGVPPPYRFPALDDTLADTNLLAICAVK